MHTHQATSTKNLPFGGSLSFCACGARRMSDGSEIHGGTLDTDGWYLQKIDHRAAYNSLQNEGHSEPAPLRDMVDEFDSGRGE